MSSDRALWKQFRRLLLGTVIEALLDEGVAVDFNSISIDFHRDSAFEVPRLNNYMRFKGELSGRLTRPLAAAARNRLRDRLDDAWPEIVGIMDLPIGDRLTQERNVVQVDVEGEKGADLGILHIRFDLEAD